MDLSGSSVSIDGCFAYMSKQTWIMTCSVKENTLFEEAFDAKKVSIKNLRNVLSALYYPYEEGILLWYILKLKPFLGIIILFGLRRTRHQPGRWAEAAYRHG